MQEKNLHWVFALQVKRLSQENVFMWGIGTNLIFFSVIILL